MTTITLTFTQMQGVFHLTAGRTVNPGKIRCRSFIPRPRENYRAGEVIEPGEVSTRARQGAGHAAAVGSHLGRTIVCRTAGRTEDRKSTRLNSSHSQIS